MSKKGEQNSVSAAGVIICPFASDQVNSTIGRIKTLQLDEGTLMVKEFILW